MKLNLRRPFRSLRGRVSALILFTNFLTLGLLSSASAIYEFYQARDNLARELSSVAGAIGRNSAAALSFGERRTALENLEAFSEDTRVLKAAIYTAGAELFATYDGPGQKPGALAFTTRAVDFDPHSALLSNPIEWNGQTLGYILVHADLSQLRTRALGYAAVSGLVLFFSLAIGFAVAHRLLAVVVHPIHALARAARSITNRADYEMRVAKLADDEVGELTDCFNRMLGQIGDRDRELNLHREHLSELVRTRTAELEIARAKAEEAARLKSEFLANMSHEIRTPLNGIVGLTELALDAPLPREAREHLELVSVSAANLLGVINDILDFSKIEAGRMTAENIPFDLCQTVGALLKSLALDAQRKGLELVFAVRELPSPWVSGDPKRLSQILTNLIGNAIKFTPTGEIVVSLEVEQAGEEQLEARFAIRDSGIGIPREKQDVIFDSFTQADSSTTREYGGTGLGLAISSRLVALLGGAISVESEPGRGSTFRFSVKLGPVTNAPPAARPAFPAGLAVLIADDHPDVREALTTLTRLFGLSPSAASSAGEALELARQTQFAVALVDDGMEGELVRLAGTRIVRMTPVERSGGALPDGVAAEVSKPVAPLELGDAIARVLEVAGPAAPVVAAPGVEAAPARPLRVLVAEDNPVNQRVVERMLARGGHSVRLVTNGELAVEAALEEAYDVILMDCQMPRMDGFEATGLLRRRGVRTPIIALTAYALKGDRERCLEAGMSDYLAKPISANELASKLAGIPASGLARLAERVAGEDAGKNPARKSQ